MSFVSHYNEPMDRMKIWRFTQRTGLAIPSCAIRNAYLPEDESLHNNSTHVSLHIYFSTFNSSANEGNVLEKNNDFDQLYLSNPSDLSFFALREYFSHSKFESQNQGVLYIFLFSTELIHFESFLKI